MVNAFSFLLQPGIKNVPLECFVFSPDAKFFALLKNRTQCLCTFRRVEVHSIVNFQCLFADRREKRCSFVFFVNSIWSYHYCVISQALLNFFQFPAMSSSCNGFGIGIATRKERLRAYTDAAFELVVEA